MDLLENPFHVLNATPRDNRRRIMELADERSLAIDSNESMEARSILITPRRRLSAEVAWLPGIGSKRVEEILSFLGSSPDELLAIDKLPPITRGNLLVAALARLPELKSDDVAKWIMEIASTFEDIDPEKLKIIINEERIVAGFPELSDISAVEEEIKERRRHYGKVIKSALDNLSSKELVRTVTDVVETVTDGGKKHDPILISDLVDSYEVEAHEFLEKEEENIKTLIQQLRTAVEIKRDDTTLDLLVNRLIQVVKNWDTVAQPIQVSTMSRGLRHETSYRVAGLVRELAIEMFNKHGKLEFTQQLTNMLREVFAEVVEVAERIADDAGTLDEIAERDRLLAPISELCKTALKNAEARPSSAHKEAQKILEAVPELIAYLSASKSGAAILSRGRDEIALALMNCAVIYGNRTNNWRLCVVLLEGALKCTMNQEIKIKIQENLKNISCFQRE